MDGFIYYACQCGRQFGVDREAAERHWARSYERGRRVRPLARALRALSRVVSRLECRLDDWAHKDD